MTTRIPPAANHWHLALAGSHAITAEQLLWASPPCPPTFSPADLRLSPQVEDPRSRISRRLAAELGASSTWELIREADTRTFQVATVENVIETAIWLTSQTRSE
ncbi:hypothetical protein [Streptomyces chartreusis]|uniref:hypothetical protein n=1 Tax=Streptomyces chartreusis TaxID=1969 RepID=UPI0036288DB8